jgi:hypothetical protein
MLTLASTSAGATKIARIPLDELAQDTKYIALVKVLSAQLDESDTHCGVVYTVKTLKGIKNTSKNKTLKVFSPASSAAKLRTGQDFIVFLEEKNRGVCSKASLSIGHAGYGALWVGSPYLIDFTKAVKIPKSFIAIPRGLITQAGQRPDDEISEVEWVEQVKLIEYLRKLQ